MDTFKQPEPFDANWHRYCPQKPFPPYRHIPGVTPHPIRDPRGHSYGVEEVHDAEPLPPEFWRQNEDYLYGVDLYNFAYWWEAHEAWEGLWHQAEGTYRLFLQGLIQVSAAFIKHPHANAATTAHTFYRQDAINYGKLSSNVTTHREIIWTQLTRISGNHRCIFRPFLRRQRHRSHLLPEHR